MKAEYIDHMGTDLTVVNAARVSFSKTSEWEYTKYESDPDEFGLTYDFTTQRLSDKDSKLISYLAKHDHFTPFTHCVVTLRETVPIFVARQRFKHTVGFSYNEVSRRYVDNNPEFYFPSDWRGKPENKKQGSSGTVNPILRKRMHGDQTIDEAIERLNFHATDLYFELLEHGVAPEQARMILPQSMYTEYYVTGSLAAWARAYKLRSSEDAQAEIRELATQWNDLIEPLFPNSWSALTC